MPYLTSKALLTDIEGMSFLRAVLKPGRQPAAIPQPMQTLVQSAPKPGEQPGARAKKPVLVAGS
jgi:hypothetical protein